MFVSLRSAALVDDACRGVAVPGDGSGGGL